MFIKKGIFILSFLFSLSFAFTQTGSIKGWISDTKGEPIPFTAVHIKNLSLTTHSDSAGYFEFKNLEFAEYEIVFFSFDKEKITKEIKLNRSEVFLQVTLDELHQNFNEIVIVSKRDKNFGRNYMKPVENFGIYEGKKTEVVEMSEINANIATNNARQVYAKVTGLNIWESDGAGLQLGIGGRGLSPNRTANFNVRQNGYDISADALGYPESYYTPPLEAIDRIEIVRGAASLQYGTQFGGMLNFRFKQGSATKPVEVVLRNSIGSWGFLNTFTSVGGTVNKGKINYYSFFQYKRGDGFRQNSGFASFNGYAAMSYQVTSKLKIEADFTRMHYLAQQPGGLTDKNFEDGDIRLSFRERNWFNVDWNMASVSLSYEISTKTQINTRNFGLMSSRYALGNLERINVVDFGGNRTLIKGDFMNLGNETRLLHEYNLFGRKNTLLFGTRLYKGLTRARQGNGNDGSGPEFDYLNPNELENSDYLFENKNLSLFAENIFRISDKFSVTPGIRFESISTSAEGYFMQQVFDGAGNLVVQNKTEESMGRVRKFVIGGVGLNYKLNAKNSIYLNFTQNYRAINFSDIRIVNPNFRVDPNIKDESGYTADIGFKSNKSRYFNFEATLFLVKYNDKIGQVLRADQPPLFLDYRFRGNISDARNIGLEFFGELNMIQLFKEEYPNLEWTFFVNSALVDARYINTEDNSIKNKKVEMVPPFMLRSGTQFRFKHIRATFQFSHIAQHYTDATNAVLTSTAVEGLIPSYQVADLSVAYRYKRMGVEGTINNIFNQYYFTRRAEGYPGPGIIPSDGRAFYVTLSVTI
jgi:Fe(3+) dicitrate transport protein